MLFFLIAVEFINLNKFDLYVPHSYKSYDNTRPFVYVRHEFRIVEQLR